MSDLVEFLNARIDEDEAVARNALGDDWRVDTKKQQVRVLTWEDSRVGSILEGATAFHIVRHDPARVLAECEAKRRIVATMRTAADQAWQDGDARPVIEFIADKTLRALAAMYADRPGFREEWRP